MDDRLMLEHGITRPAPFCVLISALLYRGEMPCAQAVSPGPAEQHPWRCREMR